MKTDLLTQYVAVRKALLQEKARAEARLQQINQALSEAPTAVTAAPKPLAEAPRQGRNPISMRAAVIQVTTGQAMTKPEILAAIPKLGYRTTSKHPERMLDNLLYGKNPKFKNAHGKFSPLSTATGAAPAKPGTPAAKSLEKRTLSAATRAKMSAAAKARWAKRKMPAASR